MLDDLRALARQYPDDAAGRKELALSLFNTLNDAGQEDDLARRDQLLEELRTLVDKFPDDAAVNSYLDLTDSMQLSRRK